MNNYLGNFPTFSLLLVVNLITGALSPFVIKNLITRTMQKVSIAFLVFVTTLGFVACQRDASAVSNPVSLGATKTSSIKIGEPILFTLEKASGTVQWKVNPSNNVVVNAGGNSAAILFGNPGSYQVNASAKTDSAIIIVHVTDSVYHGGDTTIPNSTTIPIS